MDYTLSYVLQRIHSRKVDHRFFSFYHNKKKAYQNICFDAPS
nr:MAG TPA: hypothetical protein [Caudoviricetes sp.]